MAEATPDYICERCGGDTGGNHRGRRCCLPCGRLRNREAMNRSRQRRMAAHPERFIAHARVANAIAAGELIRPDTCPRCGRSPITATKIEAHHPDYTKPLDVVWLCRGCHRREHAGASS